MTRAILKLKNSRLSVQCEKAKLNDWRKITSKDQKQFKKWINSYRLLLQDHTRNNRDTLLHIGGEIYGWLNGAGGWLDKFFKSSSNPPFILEFRVPAKIETVDDEINKKFLRGGPGGGSFFKKRPSWPPEANQFPGGALGTVGR